MNKINCEHCPARSPPSEFFADGEQRGSSTTRPLDLFLAAALAAIRPAFNLQLNYAAVGIALLHATISCESGIMRLAYSSPPFLSFSPRLIFFLCI